MQITQRSLVSLLTSRQYYNIPKETHILHHENWFFETDKYCIQNAQKHPELHEKIKESMISTFYREAPVPIALNLANKNCRKTRDFVDKEIDAALNSGCSVIYTKPQQSEIIRVALNLIWQRNNEYEVIGASSKSWHNAAAEIIASNPEMGDKLLVWRNYQFQHIYDVGQKLLQQRPEKKYALYLSMGYINPEFRRSSSSSVFRSSSLDDYHEHWNLADCIVYFMTTFSKMDDHLQKNYSNSNYKPFDYVSYAEQELILEGRRCFEPFINLGGITYYVNFVEDVSSV